LNFIKIPTFLKNKKCLLRGMGGLCLLLVLAVFLFPGFFLLGIAQSLVVEDELQPADAIVVLTGSNSGNRIRTAAQLFQQGYAGYLVFSGFKVYPGTYTHTMMKKYAVDLSIPEDRILTAQAHEEVSTFGEGLANLKILQANNIKTFILVTSSYHTKRAQYVYKTLIAQNNLDMI